MNTTSSIQSSILRIADDFGVDDQHDMVMLRLLNKKKIDGVSVFSELISQPQINELMIARSEHDIQIGLHFNLTHGALLPGVSKLLLRSMLLRIDKSLISKEINSQLNTFKKKFGFMPDFVDGHQHVHAFPVINKVVAQALVSIKFQGWVRNIGSGSFIGWSEALKSALKGSYFKKFIILEVLGLFHRRHLNFFGITFNQFFFGLMPLDSPIKLPIALLNLYEIKFHQSTVIMCHPGSIEGIGAKDHPSESRAVEASFLSIH